MRNVVISGGTKKGKEGEDGGEGRNGMRRGTT